MWSIGVMAYALVSGEFPWYSESRDVCGQMIKYTPLRFPEKVGDRTSESQHHTNSIDSALVVDVVLVVISQPLSSSPLG